MTTFSKVTLFVLLSLLAAASVGAWAYLLKRQPEPAPASAPGHATESTELDLSTYQAESLESAFKGYPAITHLVTVDLDADGLLDLIVCDAEANRVSWIRQAPQRVFTNTPLGGPIPAPGRVAIGDLNQDGRLDLVVASLGRVRPNGDRIGRIVVLENLGENQFRSLVIAENLLRVSDIRLADLNGDGRLDLVVGEYDPVQGGVSWMENLGEGRFQRHDLSAQAGVVAAPAADFDGDGKMDIAVLLTTQRTEIRMLRNGGDGAFRESVVWTGAPDTPAGNGLEVCDLNRDGKPDLVWAEGGNLHVEFPEPSPQDGLNWLENAGGTFGYHRIGAMRGAHGPVAADIDADGDTDLLAVAPNNCVRDADAVWLMAWLNDGKQTFTSEPLARDPIRLFTVAAGDLDGNGGPVLVAGALHLSPPGLRLSHVTLWRRP